MIVIMEFQQLRYALAVERTRNFTRAAEECFVVQSALSQQVKALEAELGVQLFARTSRRVEVTPAGEAFLTWARTSLEAAERAKEDALAATGVVAGRLRIGAIPTVTAIDLPDALAEFRSRHPQVRVSLTVGGSDLFQAGLQSGDLDIALLGLSASVTPSVEHRELDRRRNVLVTAARHPLAAGRPVRLADIADEEFADFPAGGSGRIQSDLAFADAGLTREVTVETMSVSLMLDLVARGLAVALLPPGSVPERSDLAVTPVVDGPERVEYVAWNSFNPSPAAKAFLAQLGVA